MDHAEIAAQWLLEAAGGDGTASGVTPQADALIAIGHALLALGETLKGAAAR